MLPSIGRYSILSSTNCHPWVYYFRGRRLYRLDPFCRCVLSIFIRCSFYEYALEVSPVCLLNRNFRVIKKQSHGLFVAFLRHYRNITHFTFLVTLLN